MSSTEENNKNQLNKIQNLENEVNRLKSAVEELSLLNDLAIAAGRTLDFDKLLNIIVQKSISVLKAEQGVIQLVAPKEDSLLNTLIRREAQSGRIPSYKVGNYISGWVIKNKKPLLIEKLSEDNRFQTTMEEQKEIKTLICVPIWIKSEIIGVFILTNKKTGEAFNSNDLRLLNIVGAQAGQLIFNSQLQEEAVEKKRLENELQLARKIQMSLIPDSNPNISQLDIASFFISADAVSGDYYDYIKIDDNKIGVVVADVSGHGPSAALMMTMIKGILHSITSNFVSANLVLKEINSVFSRIAPEEMFVTMMILVFDLEKHVMQYSNAGHNPLLYFNSKDNVCETLILDGCAINILPNSSFGIKEISYKDKDLFIIYTDGITEAVNDNLEMFGTNRLVRIISEANNQEAGDIIESIKTEFYSFTKNRYPIDDLALIAIKIKE